MVSGMTKGNKPSFIPRTEIKVFRLIDYQHDYINRQIKKQIHFSRSEVIRHAILLYIAALKNLKDYTIIDPHDRNRFRTANICVKLPLGLVDKVGDILVRFDITLATFVRAAVDHWVKWWNGVLDFDQELFLASNGGPI